MIAPHSGQSDVHEVDNEWPREGSHNKIFLKTKDPMALQTTAFGFRRGALALPFSGESTACAKPRHTPSIVSQHERLSGFNDVQRPFNLDKFKFIPMAEQENRFGIVAETILKMWYLVLV